ncbi:MAG: RtcB family protein [Candidatus Aenigmatarchaeota archaeon]
MDINKFKKISDFEWQIEKTGEMLVPGLIVADEKLIREMDDKVWEQVTNVASLPGIQKASLAMPDAHWGYGFPIGGVGAFDPDNGGVITVGGVGFDGGCGVRTLKTNLMLNDVKPKIKQVVDALFKTVPAGLGCEGEIRLSRSEADELYRKGAKFVVEKGYGTKDDLEHTEENGSIDGADPNNVSETAKKRERGQVGTLGSGNHYLEVQYVDEIYDENAARVYDLQKNQILISIHCGSRALGHQIGTDYLHVLDQASRKYGIKIRDRELVCAPINSEEGQKYYSAMCCALNYAYANRQVIAHLVREQFTKIFPGCEVKTLYDIVHNSCKIEKHEINGKIKKLYVHRKGSTRAFGPNREEIPHDHRDIGQVVIIGGTMGTASYILRGTDYGMRLTFGSSCHGAGRTMSRIGAKKQFRGDRLIHELESKGIYVKCHSLPGLAEEAPNAYKDVSEVVEVMDKANIAKKVVRLRPIGNIKG